MKSLLMSFVLVCACASSFYSQKVNRWYQDGKVVFELSNQVKKYKSFNGIVEGKSLPFSNAAVYRYQITGVKALHQNIKDDKLSRTYQVEFNNIYEVESLIDLIKETIDVVYAEKKELHENFLTPNDTYFSNSFSNGQWGLYQINAPAAWDISTGDANVVVAVTDNAIQINHPDLVNKLVPGRDVVDNDNDPSPCGGNDGFHGSHVSGIVGAESNNNLGVASIGYDVSIMPIKIGNCSTGALTGGYDGIIWATDNGADVINMSWGGGGVSSYGQNVCDYAWNNGSILVAAAGNNGTSQQFYPAAYNNVISVASTTSGDSKSSFSQYGTWIDVSCPGSSILSCNQTTGYQITQGTSMASPMVAGLVGLMISHAQSASKQDIVSCLLSSCDNIDAANSNYVGQLGAGRVNAEQALLCLNAFTYTLDASITQITSPFDQVCDSSVTPEFVLRNLGSQTLNSVVISYQYDNGAVQTYNWSGSLTQGNTENITLPSQGLAAGAHTLNISCSAPNAAVDQNNQNDSQSNSFTIIVNGQQATIDVLTDCYGSEITWTLTPQGGTTVLAQGGPYQDVAGGQMNSSNVCLSAGCYVFTINDTYGDGMYGSQWQSCSVDGSYSISDANGNVVASTIAANANFGNQEINNFCIVSNLTYDIGVSQIISPEGPTCNPAVVGEIELFNYGSLAVSSVDITYDYGGTPQTTTYTNTIAPGTSVLVSLPVANLTGGAATFNVTVSNPNGNVDQNQANDNMNSNIYVYDTYASLPFTEDFETNGFNNNEWYMTNPDNDITWGIATVVGTNPGNKAAKIDFYNYSAGGQRDGFQTPPLDLSSQTNVVMTFEHAFRRYDQQSRDSLAILVSTDCGDNFTYIGSYAEDGSGTFATAYTSTVDFVPTAADWCMGTVGANCFSIDLDAYSGVNGLIIRFESVNNGIAGNNLFIDNINITGTQVSIPPTANFTPSSTSICEGETVQFSNSSTGVITQNSWDFGDGSNSTSASPSHTYTSPGTYTVSLTVTNSLGSDTYTQTISVNANPTVTLTSSLNTVCSTDNPFDLMGSPSGGTYAGPGMNGSNFSPSSAGVGTHTITYSFTDNNGCSGSAQVSIQVDDCSGMEESILNSLVLFPNPNDGRFTFSRVIDGAEMTVYSIDGKLIYQDIMSNNNKWIDLKAIESGIYRISVKTNGVTKQFSFIIR